MSQDNVEIVRRAFAGYAEGGVEGLLEHLDPEIEWTTTGAFLNPATYRGHQEVRDYLGLFDDFDDLRYELEEFIDAGKQLVVRSRISGTGKRSGASVDLILYSVCSFRGERILRISNHATRVEAFESAGLSESG